MSKRDWSSDVCSSDLAVHYREKNELGDYIGGPMYYITKGLGMKWLGVWFAIAMMVEVGASIMVQGNSLALSVRETFNITPWVTGVIIMLLMAVVIIGGIKRIGSFTEKLVPMMIILYLVGTFLVVIIHIDMFTEVL